MRRGLVGGELRMHHRVTQLAAELDRVGELVSLVAANSADHGEHHHEAQHKGSCAALRGVIQIKFCKMKWRSDVLQTTASLPHHPSGNEKQAQHQECRTYHVGEHADVGCASRGDHVDQDQEKNIC